MWDTLKKIEEFADMAHGDQQRKYLAERYIEHPRRVMKMCEPFISSQPVLGAALLHDVLEDTDYTRHGLRDFLSTIMDNDDVAQTMRLVIELTDVYIRQDYPKWARKKRRRKEAERLSHASPEAQTIKYADIIDNCRGIATQDPEFAPVYLRECKKLLIQMTKGVQALREQALQTVAYEKALLATSAMEQNP